MMFTEKVSTPIKLGFLYTGDNLPDVDSFIRTYAPGRGERSYTNFLSKVTANHFVVYDPASSSGLSIVEETEFMADHEIYSPGEGGDQPPPPPPPSGDDGQDP